MDRLEPIRISRGIVAGLAGGLVFGIMMTAMGMIGMIGGLVGQPGNVAVAWLVHLVISALIGLGFAFVAPATASSAVLGAVGLVYGFVWWVLGPLLIMPVMMGMGPQLSASGIQSAMPSLWGHLAYGAVLGIAFAVTARGWPTVESAEQVR